MADIGDDHAVRDLALRIAVAIRDFGERHDPYLSASPRALYAEIFRAAEQILGLEHAHAATRRTTNSREWPPLMPTHDAALYCSQSKWSLQRAIQRGELDPAGKRGRTFVFRRDDLDRYMLGSRGKRP